MSRFVLSGKSNLNSASQLMLCYVGTAMLEHVLQLCEQDGTFDNMYL